MNAASIREDRTAELDPVPVLERIPGRQELDHLDRRVRSFVAERPVTAVLLALAVGYVAGRIIVRVS